MAKRKAKVGIMLINESTKVKLGYLGTMEGKNMYEIVRNNPDFVIDMYKEMEPDTKRYCETDREFFKINRDAKAYYIFKRTNGIDIFKELPLVEDTDLFKWTYMKRGRVDMLWTQLSQGALRYNCSYLLKTKNIHIIVMYESATLKHIWINDGGNEEILDAIREFNSNFQATIGRSVNEKLQETNRFA